MEEEIDFEENWNSNEISNEIEDESLFKLVGTEYEGKTPEGLKFHAKAPPIKGILDMHRKFELTFVFESRKEKKIVEQFFLQGERSRIPKGERILAILEKYNLGVIK